MPELTRPQIIALTGLSASQVNHGLARFPAAKSGRGRYTTDDADFAAWLNRQSVNQEQAALVNEIESNPNFRQDALVWLPSGIFMSSTRWRAMRGADEAAALAALDLECRDWRLPPHHLVPDELPWQPLTLPSGHVVNGHQWRRFRKSHAAGARGVLDVLLRSWPDYEPDL